jgi:hypothetical protein
MIPITRNQRVVSFEEFIGLIKNSMMNTKGIFNSKPYMEYLLGHLGACYINQW